MFNKPGMVNCTWDWMTQKLEDFQSAPVPIGGYPKIPPYFAVEQIVVQRKPSYFAFQKTSPGDFEYVWMYKHRRVGNLPDDIHIYIAQLWRAGHDAKLNQQKYTKLSTDFDRRSTVLENWWLRLDWSLWLFDRCLSLVWLMVIVCSLPVAGLIDDSDCLLAACHWFD